MRQSSQERIAPVRCELRRQPGATETLILVSLTSTKPDSNEGRHPLIRQAGRGDSWKSSQRLSQKFAAGCKSSRFHHKRSTGGLSVLRKNPPSW